MVKNGVLFCVILLIISCKQGGDNRKKIAEKIGKDKITNIGGGNDNQINFITKNSIGPLYLGMQLNDAKKLFSKDSIQFDTELGYLVLRKNKPLVGFSSKSGNKLTGITSYSSLYHLENGIKVGTTLKSLKRAFPKMKLQIDAIEGEEEYFEPEEYQTNDQNGNPLTVFQIYVGSSKEKRLGKYRNFSPDEKTSNFSLNGDIYKIEIYCFDQCDK